MKKGDIEKSLKRFLKRGEYNVREAHCTNYGWL